MTNIDLFINELRRKNTNNNVSSMARPSLKRYETIGDNDVENLEVINLNALTNEVKTKGVGNRGSPTFSLTESLENLPVKRSWHYNPFFKRKTLKKRGGKRRQTKKSRRYRKK